ncbi:MAG: AsmA family protein, partial [Rhodospirillales bacterium]|nr:AsmA family protein [Rhodospirillales bacterium]
MAPQAYTAPTNPRRRWLRVVLVVLAVLIVVPAAALAIFLNQFNPDTYKPQIIAAVRAATGRTLTLGGPIRLGIALRPTLEITDVALSNPTGFSRPQMMTLQKLDVRLALLPLLDRRVVIDRLVLVHPDIRLETDKAGATNWQFVPPAAPSSPAGSPAATAAAVPPPKPGGMPLAIAVRSISMQDGTLALVDDRTGKTTTLALKDLSATEADAAAPMLLDVAAAFNGLPFTLHGSIGALSRLQDPLSRAPWPVALRLAAGNGTLDVQGSLSDPTAGRGYALRITADLPSLDVIRAVQPGLDLPKLDKIHLAATIADQGGPLPKISALVIGVGTGDLGQYVPGMSLDHLDVHAAEPDKPIVVSFAGSRGKVPLALTATLGTLDQLMPGAPASPFPVEASVQAGSGDAAAALSVKGSIADAAKLTGASLAIQGKIGDLGALAPLAGQSLPALKDVTLAATLTDQGRGLAHDVTLNGLSLTTPQADLTGSAGLALGPRPVLTATLSSKRIDADALLAAMAGTPVQGSAAAPGPAPA